MSEASRDRIEEPEGVPVTLAVEVRLVERLDDRARVLVTLTPRAETSVDAVTVQLFSEDCEPIGNRVVLPIAGTLTDAIAVHAEVRGHEGLPERAVIVATAWRETEYVRAWCPADPWTAFEAHVRGKRCVMCTAGGIARDFVSMRRKDLAALAKVLPWVRGEDRAAEEGELCEIGEDIDEISAEMGLDATDAALLKEILGDLE